MIEIRGEAKIATSSGLVDNRAYGRMGAGGACQRDASPGARSGHSQRPLTGTTSERQHVCQSDCAARLLPSMTGLGELQVRFVLTSFTGRPRPAGPSLSPSLRPALTTGRARLSKERRRTYARMECFPRHLVLRPPSGFNLAEQGCLDALGRLLALVHADEGRVRPGLALKVGGRSPGECAAVGNSSIAVGCRCRPLTGCRRCHRLLTVRKR